jgi:hypothetical protein
MFRLYKLSKMVCRCGQRERWREAQQTLGKNRAAPLHPDGADVTETLKTLLATHGFTVWIICKFFGLCQDLGQGPNPNHTVCFFSSELQSYELHYNREQTEALLMIEYVQGAQLDNGAALLFVVRINHLVRQQRD